MQLATALLHKPQLIILDEPFSGLDPVNVDPLKAVIQEQVRAGRTLLFSSHRMDLLEELCQGVCLIAGGPSILAGTLDEVKRAGGAIQSLLLAPMFLPRPTRPGPYRQAISTTSWDTNNTSGGSYVR